MEDCLEHDIKLWKLDRIENNEKDKQKIIKIIKQNFFKLNEIFISFASRCARYPTIGQQDMSQFCRAAKIIDKNITTQRIDQLFVATNVEIVDQKFNDDKALCRFEFFEILIRIAKDMHVDT